MSDDAPRKSKKQIIQDESQEDGKSKSNEEPEKNKDDSDSEADLF